MAKKVTFGEIDGFKTMAEEIKKAKLNKAQLIERVVNKQLSPLYRTIETLKDRELFELKVSAEEHDQWMQWGARFIQKNSDNLEHRNRKSAETEMSWISEGFGLKVKGGWEAQKVYFKNQDISVL